MFGVGIDLVAISRFERFLHEKNCALFKRLFTEGENEYCCKMKNSAQHFATRFAAKEAFLKALGTGLRDGLSWTDIEVVKDHLGNPSLTLSGKALEMFEAQGLKRCHVSLSHDGNVAIAMAVLE